MHRLSPVQPAELDTLPVQIQHTAALRCTPAQLFESFARAEDWRLWLQLEVEWTSEPPFGPGTTRIVRTSGLTAEETFTEWRPGERMSFYFSRSNSALFSQFAEQWTVTEAPGGCTLRWRAALRPSALGWPLVPAIRAALLSGFRRGLPVLAALARGERAAVRWQDVVSPGLQPMLRRLPGMTFGPWTVTAINTLLRGARRVAPAPAGASLRVVTQGEQELRVFTPVATPQIPAALIWIHGGGRVIGHPVQEDRRSAWLAEELGAVVITPSYRLAPQHRYPAALDDCVSAWEWVQAHAAELGVNPQRVGVGGESAGGGLAAELTHRLRDEGGRQPCCQFLVYPMLDDRTAADETLDGLRHPVWNNQSNRFGWSSYLGTEPGAAEVGEYAVAARRADLSGLPPAWVAVGDLDLFCREDRVYVERLRAAGVPAALEVVEGGFHGIFAGERGEPDLDGLREGLLGFLRQHLGGYSAAE